MTLRFKFVITFLLLLVTMGAVDIGFWLMNMPDTVSLTGGLLWLAGLVVVVPTLFIWLWRTR